LEAFGHYFFELRPQSIPWVAQTHFIWSELGQAAPAKLIRLKRPMRATYTAALFRNSNFWILPVEVFGIGSKRKSQGTL
jgi:hypothetical protein